MNSHNPVSLVWDWHRKRIIKRSLEKYLSFNDLKDMRVLDVGCGRNKLYEFSLGVDREKYAGVDIVGDYHIIEDLPKAFDVSLMLQFLEHFDKPKEVFNLVASKTVAFVVVDVPNCESWLWRVVWWFWRGVGMAKESVHRDLKKSELLEIVKERFSVLEVKSYWFGMLTCVIGGPLDQ